MVAVHYVGCLKETGTVFMDTRKEGEQVTLVAGRGAFADRRCDTGYRLLLVRV